MLSAWPNNANSAAASSRPVTVCFVVSSLHVGGAEKHVVSLINRLSPARHRASLVYLKDSDNDPLLTQIDAARCPNGILPLGVHKGIEWRAARALAEHVDANRADVVVCTNMYALLYGLLARALCRRKPHVIEVFHTTDVQSLKERAAMALLYRPLLRLTGMMVYVCDRQARHWRRMGLKPQRDVVIHNGIDSRYFSDIWSAEQKASFRRRHGFDSTDYVVGLCAVMRPEKAHGDLLLAVRRLRDQGLPIRCLLIGDGPERARIESRIRELGLQRDVKLTGALQDVRPAIASCDVMVLASHAVETFSLAALESMSLGKPMVMAEIGGASEQVTHGENGLLYPPGDIDALAGCLRTMADAPLRQRAGARAARRVREAFDIETMVGRYERMLTEVADGRRTAANR